MSWAPIHARKTFIVLAPEVCACTCVFMGTRACGQVCVNTENRFNAQKPFSLANTITSDKNRACQVQNYKVFTMCQLLWSRSSCRSMRKLWTFLWPSCETLVLRRITVSLDRRTKTGNISSRYCWESTYGQATSEIIIRWFIPTWVFKSKTEVTQMST